MEVAAEGELEALVEGFAEEVFIALQEAFAEFAQEEAIQDGIGREFRRAF